MHRPVILALAIAVIACTNSFAQPASTAPEKRLVISGVGEDAVVRIAAEKSIVLRTSRPFKRVTIAKPDIADVSAVTPTQLYIVGLRAGSTSLTVWDDSDQFEVYEVVVTGGAGTSGAAAGKAAWAVHGSEIAGFIALKSDDATLHLNVHQIIAIRVTPTKQASEKSPAANAPAETMTRIVIAGAGDALPRAFEISSKQTSVEEVLATIKAAREAGGPVISPQSREPRGR